MSPVAGSRCLTKVNVMNRSLATGLITLAMALAAAVPGMARTPGVEKGNQAPGYAGALTAGAAKADITPTPDILPIRSTSLLSSVHDPIFARALVLENGRDKVALVTLDTTEVPSGSELPEAISAALHIPRERIVVSATHNHSAPGGGASEGRPVDPRYAAIVKAGVLKAVLEADGRRQPARIGFGAGKAFVNVNRDEQIGAGYHMGFVPEGPSDKTVAVVSVTAVTGKPIAVYANYAVHGVVMYRAHTKDGEIQVTGDLPGWTSRYVEDKLGDGAVALWTSGAAGDQNPTYMATYNQDGPDVVDEGAAAWALLDVQSRRLGEEIVRVTGRIGNTASKVTLWGDTATVTCPGQKRAQPAVPGVPNTGYLAPSDVKMIDSDPVAIPLALLMINDIAIAGASAEVYSEIGQSVKRQSLFDQTMLVTLLPNREGYIPTDKAYLLPTEKAVNNRLKPGCAEPGMVAAYRAMEARYLEVWLRGR
jgi:neutral ceramidase